jgi:hypothetical protein
MVRVVGSLDKTFEIFDVKEPMDFLNLFNELDVIQSEERPSWTLYRYKKGYNIMIHDRRSDAVYINYGDIWSVLEQKHLTNYYDISNLIKDWLDDTYNLKRTRPTWVFENFQNWDWMISMI